MNKLIEKEGIYDLSEYFYQADPVKGGSLRASSAKILFHETPKKFLSVENEKNLNSSKFFEIGKIAHTLLLGSGSEIAVFNGDNWRKKDAQIFRQEALEKNQIPILLDEFEQIEKMISVVKKNEKLKKLMAHGKPEQTLIWRDEENQIFKRARLDWLPAVPMVIFDYKTTKDLSYKTIKNCVLSNSYHMQASFYCEGVKKIFSEIEDLKFIFLFQEKTPPFDFRFFELDSELLDLGKKQNDIASKIFAHCKATNQWEGYDDKIETIFVEDWFLKQIEGKILTYENERARK